MGSREDNIYFARLAEQGERYEDMIKYMKDVAMVRYIYPDTPHQILYI